MNVNPRTSTLGLQSDPCTDYLSDSHFLRHMISHHQVAIDMSLEALRESTDDLVRRIAFRITKQQDYEIAVMTWHLHSDGSGQIGLTDHPSEHARMLESYEPDAILPHASYECDPLFFDPDAHMKRHHDMGPYSDHMFIHHMIPHHQVAVDMSRRLLAHSSHMPTRTIASKIILDQQYEIRSMNEWLDQN